MELNEQEAHCVARLLQGLLYGEDYTDGCQYCKYQCGNRLPKFYAMIKRLTEETGVDVSPSSTACLPHSNFPYSKFLKNSNEPVKEYFRTRFANYLSSISLISGQ